MDIQSATSILNNWDLDGRYVYARRDLEKIFPENPKNLSMTISRLVKAGVLMHVARNVYVLANSRNRGAYTVEEVAQALRQNSYNYVSYESALSEYGVISQIPVGRITVATTGREGLFETPFGTIEFTHTKINPRVILDNTLKRSPHPLPIATVEFALKNLRRSGRSLDLVDQNWQEN